MIKNLSKICNLDKLTSINASNTYNLIRDVIDRLLSQKVFEGKQQSFES